MSSFDIDAALRWLARRGVPAAAGHALASDDPRYVDPDGTITQHVLLDTCVYIDQLRGSVPAAVDDVLSRSFAHHSIVAMQELAHAVGVLDPADGRTARTVAAIAARMRGVSPHRLHVPDADTLGRAALLAGYLCRLRGYARDDRMRALHDCVLFLQARKRGYAVLTANVRDFALLVRMEPHGRVLFYRTG